LDEHPDGEPSLALLGGRELAMLRAALSPSSLLEKARHLPSLAGFAKRRPFLFASAAIAVLSVLFLLGLVAASPLPDDLRAPVGASLRVLSRTGSLLREVRTKDGTKARPLRLSEFPPRVRAAVLAAEDSRFYSHYGVDPVAVLRAIGQNLWSRRVVSGASTLTMQLARSLSPHPRTLWGKIREAALAIRIEMSLSKDEILEAYLNRIPYGPNVRGYGGASLAYFGVSPSSLSLAEAALLAGLPRGPSLYALDRHVARAKRRRDRVLGRMADAGQIDGRERDLAVAEPVAPEIDKPSFGAPHFVAALVDGRLDGLQQGLSLARGAAPSEITTTIDPRIQRSAEVAVTSALVSIADKHVTAAAVVVLENATGDILAYVGSPDMFNDSALGANDGVLALRQPGSSLKPFVYAEAMTTLHYTGATLLPDVEIHIPLPGGGDYVPHDYDGRFHGPVRLREALGNSFNIPAVYTLYQLGTRRVLDRLRAFGFASLTDDAEHYGPALALGDGEVTLLEIANAYATLARGGVYRGVRAAMRISVPGEGEAGAPLPAGESSRLVEEGVAALLADILSDKSARVAAFGDQNVLELDFDVAAKTGTSKGYRDNIAVGFTREVTVATWVGNFDGSPMAGVSGITGAGPIFHAVMEAAMEDRPHSRLTLDAAASRLGLAHTPICALSGDLPTAACPHTLLEWLPEDDASHGAPCRVHQSMRIDARNSLRAGPACSLDKTSERTFEQWDEAYAGWALATGRPVAPTESSPACPVESPELASFGVDARPSIVYPLDGSSFLIDPERPIDLQALDIRVSPAGTKAVVTVDGVVLRDASHWPLHVGEHTIVAEVDHVSSAPIHVKVR
jgi:penicillin-binding protein 1C